MTAWIGAADLPGEGGYRSLQRGPFVRLEIEGDHVWLSGVGPLGRVIKERKGEASAISSIQIARGFLAKGVRLDFADGDVVYFWTGQAGAIVETLRRLGTHVFDGVYRRRWLSSKPDDYRSRA